MQKKRYLVAMFTGMTVVGLSVALPTRPMAAQRQRFFTRERASRKRPCALPFKALGGGWDASKLPMSQGVRSGFRIPTHRGR
jgi:hypothetical protein